MNVFADLFLSDDAVKKYADKRRPHIKEVQTVEAVRYNKHISGEDSCVGFCAAEISDKVCAQAADRRIEERAAKATKCEIICNELAR